MLVLIKLVHTIVWAFFVACILGIFWAAQRERFDWALWLIGAVLVEVVVLAVNRLRCPLTPIAARYTEERAANFDIYLPLFVARFNKEIFGSLFVLGVAYTAYRWFS
jgi:cbb3-type cytochrome oxidase subunit 1